MFRLAILALLLTSTAPAWAFERSSVHTRAFQRANPCPSTDARRGSCSGWVIDHVRPLCTGGKDHPENMQWQTVADARAKDIEEWRECRALRRAKMGQA